MPSGPVEASAVAKLRSLPHYSRVSYAKVSVLNILILGTSNSIMREGWVAGLRAALPDSFISNRSIGASPGTQFSAAMAYDFASFDFVFLDSVPNDEQRFNGSDEVDYLNRICFEIASTIAAQTNLIILAFCLDRFLSKPTEIFSARRNIASAVNAQFVDVRQLVISRGPALLNGLPLYEQEAHPHRQFPSASDMSWGWHFYGELPGSRLCLKDQQISLLTSPFST
jgi:hypothetical protein